MASFKKLNNADVILVPYPANKQWAFNYSCTPESDDNLKIYKGTKVISSQFCSEDPSVDPITNDQYERLVYNNINHLFYQQYSGSYLNTHSISLSPENYVSASSLRPSSSYFIYNDKIIKQFPSASGEGIRVLAIAQNRYGSRLLPNTFQLSSSQYYVIDDGVGNLYDTNVSPAALIGNVFYSHGIAVITNQDYQNMFPLPPLVYNDVATFNDVDFPKTISILSNDIPRTGILDTGSVVLSGSNAQYYTINSNGTITLNYSSSGNYDVYYTVKNYFNNGQCGLTSNKAKVSVTVTDECICTTYVLTNLIVDGTITSFSYVNCNKETVVVTCDGKGEQQFTVCVCGSKIYYDVAEFTVASVTVGCATTDCSLEGFAAFYTPPKPSFFVTTWNTAITGSGSSNNKQIRLPLVTGGVYSFIAKWGDNTSSSISSSVQSDLTHSYATAGTYTVVITGSINGWNLSGSKDSQKLLSVSEWGPLRLDSGSIAGSYFTSCSNLDLSGVTDVLNLTGVTSFYNMFSGCKKLTKVNRMNEWNTNKIISLSNMFSNCGLFNQNIGSWDTSNVVSGYFTFSSASSFDQNIGSWNTSNFANMAYMFINATSFNNSGSDSIKDWNTSKLIDVSSMFTNAYAFNQPLTNWDVSKVIDMSAMFSNARSFNQPLANWERTTPTTSTVKNVLGSPYMFQSAYAFNQPIGNWNTSGSKNMGAMFSNARAFNQDIGNWDTRNVTYMSNMFNNAFNFNNGDSWTIAKWNTSKVTDMSQMFQNAAKFNQNIGVSSSFWNTGNVLDMSFMFTANSVTGSIFDNSGSDSINSWDTAKVTTMKSMFQSARGFNRPINNWNVGFVTTLDAFMSGKSTSNYSSSKYDAILNSWYALGGLRTNVSASFGSIQYTSAGSGSRNNLTASFGWRISDGGRI
jgi:surface protein